MNENKQDMAIKSKNEQLNERKQAQEACFWKILENDDCVRGEAGL